MSPKGIHDAPLFADLYTPEAIEPEVDVEDWRISVRLTLTEIKAICRGELPPSLVQYCRDGLQALEGTPEMAACEAHEAAR